MTDKLTLKDSSAGKRKLTVEETYDTSTPSLDISIYNDDENYVECIFLDTSNLKLLYEYIGEFLKETEDYHRGFSANPFESKVSTLFDSLSKMLVAKNKAYGDSALNPVNVFSKADSTSVICQQIDHKISRIQNSTELSQNDVGDLIGYLTLLCLSKNWKDFDKQ